MKSFDPPAVIGLRDVLWIAAAIAILSLAGCANGVTLTDEEAVACRNDGCAAFTEREFLQFMGGAFKDGYLKGWTDSNWQGGRSL